MIKTTECESVQSNVNLEEKKFPCLLILLFKCIVSIYIIILYVAENVYLFNLKMILIIFVDFITEV